VPPRLPTIYFCSVNFRAAQSLRPTSCGCLFKHISIFCDSSCGSSVAATRTLCGVYRPIISRHFMFDKVSRSLVLSPPPLHQILATPVSSSNIVDDLWSLSLRTTAVHHIGCYNRHCSGDTISLEAHSPLRRPEPSEDYTQLCCRIRQMTVAVNSRHL